jgi:LytS/YehU family sensor histidine kinase
MTILGVLGYVVYYQRKLKHQYKTSNLEQRLLRSQLNPHFLFNALNSVSGLVQKKSDQTIPYISKLGALLRSILENSREEFISLEEELDTIATYLELQSNFSKKFTFDIQIHENLNKEELLIPPMFLQPFIENAIDHGFKGNEEEKITITVVQKPKDQVLYFSIEDNGIGYSNTMKNKKDMLGHQSLSGTILKERLELYARAFKKKARYVIEDVGTGEGTRVHLYLPYQLDV